MEEFSHIVRRAKDIQTSTKVILGELIKYKVIQQAEKTGKYVLHADDLYLIKKGKNPFPYKNSKVVPSKYDVAVQLETPIVTNIAEMGGGITRSGHVYAPVYMRKENPTKEKHAKILPKTRKKKSKVVEEEVGNEEIFEKEALEFLKFIP
ncbi:hypothetical protein CR513_27245, partial [Mucuna pruriens]